MNLGFFIPLVAGAFFVLLSYGYFIKKDNVKKENIVLFNRLSLCLRILGILLLFGWLFMLIFFKFIL